MHTKKHATTRLPKILNFNKNTTLVCPMFEIKLII
jgi:hypothetical protein